MRSRPLEVKVAVVLVVLSAVLQLVYAYAQVLSMHSPEGLLKNLSEPFYWVILAIFFGCAALLYLRQGWMRWALCAYWIVQAIEIINAKSQWYDGLQVTAISFGFLTVLLCFSSAASSWFQKQAGTAMSQ